MKINALLSKVKSVLLLVWSIGLGFLCPTCSSVRKGEKKNRSCIERQNILLILFALMNLRRLGEGLVMFGPSTKYYANY